MSRAERLKLAQTISTAITGKPAFANTTPTPAEFEALRAGSAGAEAAITNNDVVVRGQLREAGTTAADALVDGLEKLAVSLEGITLGDPTELSKTGFSFFTPGGPGPSVDMTKPENYSLTAGDYEGQLQGHCDPVHMARGYHIQICYEMTATPAWEDLEGSPNSQFTIKNLTSGRRAWVRIRAHGTKGPGPWSDPATKIIP